MTYMAKQTKKRDPLAVTRGVKIREARKEAKLSQQGLGDLVGVSRENISQWESGDISEIRHVNLIALSSALSIPVHELTLNMVKEASAEYVARLVNDALKGIEDVSEPKKAAKIEALREMLNKELTEE